jgi:hypothetical protein
MADTAMSRRVNAVIAMRMPFTCADCGRAPDQPAIVHLQDWGPPGRLLY